MSNMNIDKEQVVNKINEVKVKINDLTKERKRVAAIGMAVTLVVFIVCCVKVSTNNKLAVVRNGHFSVYPNATVEQLIDNTLDDVKWSYTKEDGYKYVIAKGIMRDGTGLEGLIECKFLIVDSQFRLIKVSVNGFDSGDVDGFVYAIIGDYEAVGNGSI